MAFEDINQMMNNMRAAQGSGGEGSGAQGGGPALQLLSMITRTKFDWKDVPHIGGVADAPGLFSLQGGNFATAVGGPGANKLQNAIAGELDKLKERAGQATSSFMKGYAIEEVATSSAPIAPGSGGGFEIT